MSNIRFRMAEERDVGRILEIYTPYVEGTAITFEYTAPSPEEFTLRMRRVKEMYPYLVCEAGGVVAAYAYAGKLRERAAYGWVAELSVYTDPAFSGRGIGSALYHTLIGLLRLQNITQVMGCVTAPNPPSEKLHEAMGFELVGTFYKSGYKSGKWHDVLWYQKEINVFPKAPPPVVPSHMLETRKVEEIFRDGEKLIK